MITTNDILELKTSLDSIGIVCRGEWVAWEAIYGELPIFADLTDSAETLEDVGGFLEFLATGGNIEPIVRELEKTLADLLDCAASRANEYAPPMLAEIARAEIAEYLDGNDELCQGTYKAMKEIIDLCSEWLKWIRVYFPGLDAAQLPGDPARILPVTSRPGMEPGTREASTPSRIAATNEIKSCLLVSTDKQDELLKKLHQLIDGNKGKRVALVVRLCVDLGLMSKPTFGVLAKEFPKIGNKAGYNRYYKSFQDPIYCKDFEAEINGIKQHLTPFKNQI